MYTCKLHFQDANQPKLISHEPTIEHVQSTIGHWTYFAGVAFMTVDDHDDGRCHVLDPLGFYQFTIHPPTKE